MDKISAINLIDKTFNNAFDEAQFTYFVQNLLNDFEIKPNKYSGNTIWEDQRDHVSYYKRIGKYIDPEGEALDVLIVQVKNVSKLERARTALRNFVIKHLNNFEKDYALVAFYSKEDEGFDWRFSFIKMEHQSYLDKEKQKVKMRKEFTPAKRYSFLVGKYEKSYTAKTQLLPLLQNIANNPTISELEKAFSIERVTDEFFEQYKSLYIKVYEYFKKQDLSIFQDSQLDASGFTKKLLGQIVFLYFLQKKGWLGVPKNKRWGFGDKHFVQKLFEKAQQENVNFFKDYLQYLFYEALAKERDNDNSFYPRFNCRIPFLNGGLFEAQYDWKNANISIPTELFRNDEKNNSGDEGTGILDVFDRYNFTIKEDEPLDKEVAVDPEMLGKVFENMLEIKERKSKGAFYTPREIVHYMCQESLIHYLENALNKDNNTVVLKEDIEHYIREGHLALENDVRVAERGETKTYKFLLPESVRNNADVIDKKLTEIRICDPAIGSGAFPVGLLHELVTAQLILKPHLSYNYLNNKLKEFDFHERESISESRYVYRLKKHIIQESIYGVDIDRSAIDIARLRLWLSLVVDEDDLEPIETLPNLDYKIVCGNSLIGMPDGTMRDLEVEKELEGLKEEFYTVTNEQRKKTLRNKINTKIRELLDTAETFAGYKIDFDFKLYFSEVWRDKGGFDVVIGNPPYVQLQDKERISSNLLKSYGLQNFRTFVRSGDIYSLFYEQGLKLSSPVKGILSYITSNRFCFTNYGESTRKFLSEYNLKQIINLNKVEVFKEANVGTIITIVENNKCRKGKLRAGEFISYNTNVSFIDQLFEQSKIIDSKYYNSSQWAFYDETILNLREKIIGQGTPLNQVKDLSINRGITTGLNNVFLIPVEKAFSVFKNQKSFEILKPVFKGAEIKRWKCKEHNYYLFYTYSGIKIRNYPEVFEYLSDYKEKLSNVYEARNGKKEWYELRKCRYYDSFAKRKIIWTRLSNINSFAISENGEFSIDSTSFAVGKNLEYYCAILNSRIVYFYFVLGGVIWGKDGIKWFGDYFDKIPVLLPTSETVNIFEIPYLYLKTLAHKEGFRSQFDFFEELIDAMVFELYFPTELKFYKKEILKHISDLKPIIVGISEEEKLGIIQSEYERLYHPDHPVRYAIETLDSIEEVRIIREALKS
ncbi:Eco57I restriction-modification methylase domain-containing protein [Flagellimonas lutimaris]|uniref:Eco57I restriction-modification methylase domain-containing protein n=1 Tax=Flagellimonas lutimaris TaxID=475082 RepID=UPI003F5CEDFC